MDFILRPWSTLDIDSLVQNANNPNIAQFMTDQFPHPYGKEDAIRFIEFATKDKPIHIFAIDVDGKAVGGIGIHPQSDIYRKNAEMGYWIGEDYWNKGIMSKAISKMLEFAFSTYDINRVFARPFSTNVASQKILEKNNFKLEARLQKTIYKNGEYIDELIYAVRRPD